MAVNLLFFFRIQEQHHKTSLINEEEDGYIMLLLSPTIFYDEIYIQNLMDSASLNKLVMSSMSYLDMLQARVIFVVVFVSL